MKFLVHKDGFDLQCIARTKIQKASDRCNYSLTTTCSINSSSLTPTITKVNVHESLSISAPTSLKYYFKILNFNQTLK